MLLLKLSEDCQFDTRTRTKDGTMVRMSEYSAEFLLNYCLKCMSMAEAEVVLEKRVPDFLRDDAE